MDYCILALQYFFLRKKYVNFFILFLFDNYYYYYYLLLLFYFVTDYFIHFIILDGMYFDKIIFLFLLQITSQIKVEYVTEKQIEDGEKEKDDSIKQLNGNEIKQNILKEEEKC